MRKILIIAASLAAMAAPAFAQMPPPADVVKAWDKDGDGAVSKEEWVAAGRPEARFAMVDANKDGKVTVEELEAAFKAMQQRQGG